MFRFHITETSNVGLVFAILFASALFFIDLNVGFILLNCKGLVVFIDFRLLLIFLALHFLLVVSL